MKAPSEGIKQPCATRPGEAWVLEYVLVCMYCTAFHHVAPICPARASLRQNNI
ncbi:hypothetical protein BC835DRAFT_1322442 [Cytidiella melzeri]|nr:hypothetical protein BC835DRAFT_1322442 [Cytidiella melzeri]